MWHNPKLRRSTRVNAIRRAPASRVTPGPSMVTVIVGPEQMPFRIHEQYAAQSQTFAAAFRGQFWEEARTRVMYLPETSTTLFEIFVQCLYHKRLYSDNHELKQQLLGEFATLTSVDEKDKCKGLDAKSPETWPWRVLMSLFILGDYLNAKVVRGAAIDAMILKHEKPDEMCLDDVNFAYANTGTNSKLRELLVHIVSYDADFHKLAIEGTPLPNEFLADVMVTLGRRIPKTQCQSCYQSALKGTHADTRPAHLHESQDGPPWKTLKTCYYHEHSTEEEEKECVARVAREKILERREQDSNRG